MQKPFIAIALALTLTSAFAAYTAQNYAKAPAPAVADSETNFTNTNLLTLASITSGNIYLVSGNITSNANNTNTSATSWSLWYRQFNAKTLTTTQNYTASIVAPLLPSFYNNYAVGFGFDSSSGASNLYAYQIPLTSGATAPGRLQLSNNANVNFTVTYQGLAQIGNTLYVAYLAANNTVNITSFTVGGTTAGTPFNLSTNFDSGSLSLTWGEALGSSQLFASWTEAGVLKDSIINVSKGTFSTPTAVPGYNNATQTACVSFATDSKLYGEFCRGYSNPPGFTAYWIRTYGSGNNTLQLIANYTTNTSAYNGFTPYGPYIAVFFIDSTPTSGGVNYVYEIWALDTFNTTILKQRTQYLNINASSNAVPFRVPSGGYYTLLYNYPQTVNGTTGTITGVQIGLLLGSSYLASVLGFLLTIVAGLLLF
jgi:hypothetical protein